MLYEEAFTGGVLSKKDVLENFTELTKNLSGQGSFLRIRALWQKFIYNTRKTGHAGKNVGFFLLEKLKNAF